MDDEHEEAPSPPADDGRLDRLFNYTRFHIGIYLAIGGGIAALFGSAKSFTEVSKMIGSPSALLGGLLFMAVAGLAGGIVASTTTVHRSWDDMWEAETGPWDWPLFKARQWAAIEHTAFWLGLFCIVFAVLSSGAVWDWMAHGRPPISNG